MTPLLHIARRKDWIVAVKVGQYRPESLAMEGFIHCSLIEQLLPVANELYRGQDGLVLLVVDPGHVSAEIRFEDCYKSGQVFPHVYGPLPIEAVAQVLEFEPDSNGRFILPADIKRDI